MIGILLITHGSMGEALLHNACHVLGYRPPLLAALGVAAEDAPEALLPLAERRLREVDGGDGVLVLVDIYGASPANLARRLLLPGRVEGLAGLSFPMLLRAIGYREQNLATLLAKAQHGGEQGIVHMANTEGE